MVTIGLLGGLAGCMVSLLALYAFFELSVAYWAPARSRERWLRLVALPKLATLAPSLRWMMPLGAVVSLLQFFASAQLLLAGSRIA